MGAASYAANPAGPITSIVDSQKVQVSIRQNLHECLSRLRPGDQLRVLWNDFLCTDQDDLDGKARQVAMLGDVFGGVERVRVWIGEHEDGSEMLFQGWKSSLPADEVKMKTDWKSLVEGEKQTKEEEAKERVKGGAMDLLKQLNRVVLQRSELSREESKRMTDVWMCFLNCRYCGRTWIVQEIYQARMIPVHCGSDEIPWEGLISNRFEGGGHFDGFATRAVLNVPEAAQFGDNTLGTVRALDENRKRMKIGDDEARKEYVIGRETSIRRAYYGLRHGFRRASVKSRTINIRLLAPVTMTTLPYRNRNPKPNPTQYGRLVDHDCLV
jgi:Heterokaryon incompatibility protein (HET)